MPLFLIPLIVRGATALVVVAALAWGYHLVAEHFREQGRAELRPEVAALRASIQQTQERATALALSWSAQVDKTEAAAHQAEVNRVQTFDVLRNRAKLAAAGGAAHFGGVAVRVFGNAANSAAGSPAPDTPAEPGKTIAADSGSAEEFVVSLYEWMSVCRARVDEWTSFYASLKEAADRVQ